MNSTNLRTDSISSRTLRWRANLAFLVATTGFHGLACSGSATDGVHLDAGAAGDSGVTPGDGATGDAGSSATDEEIAATNLAADRFYELVRAALSERAGDAVPGDKPISDPKPGEEWDDAEQTLTEFEEQSIESTVALEQLVFLDNTVGKVFPGAMLWAAPVRDVRLEQVRQLPGRPNVVVSFTKQFAADAAADAGIIEHDGSFSSFTAAAKKVLEAPDTSADKVAVKYKVASSMEEAMLKIGLSAEYWIGKVSANYDHRSSSKRSVAIVSLDQVYYSAAVNAPPLGGYLPESLVRSNLGIAEYLAAGAVMGGEVAYVRKVDYGRRILAILSSEAYTDEMEASLKASSDALGGSAALNIDLEQEKVWESVEGQLFVIGGEFPEGVDGFFSGDLKQFADSVRAITQAEFVNDLESAIPVSFELAYAQDDAAMQVFETKEFAGKTPLRRWGKTSYVWPEPIETTGEDAKVSGKDEDIYTDDNKYTKVILNEQALSISADGLTVSFDLSWQALEGDYGKQEVTGSTNFESSETFTYKPGQRIREILGATKVTDTRYVHGPAEEWYGGKCYDYNPFHSHGFLSNIRVRFDSQDSTDKAVQSLKATLRFEALVAQ